MSNTCVTKPNGAKECAETKEERLKREEDEKRDKECQEKRHRSMLQEWALLDKFSKRKDIDDQRDRELSKIVQALGFEGDIGAQFAGHWMFGAVEVRFQIEPLKRYARAVLRPVSLVQRLGVL